MTRRRAAILDVSMRLLERAGPAGLTLRAIAEELGGSVTLVTHIYPTRFDLLSAIAEGLLEQYDAELPELEANASPKERLMALLQWMIPLTEEGWQQERVRIMLVADMDIDSATAVRDRMDTRMRDLIREHLAPLVAQERLEPLVDLMRAITDGITLAAVEHRDKWPAERQIATLQTALVVLGLETSNLRE